MFGRIAGKTVSKIETELADLERRCSARRTEYDAAVASSAKAQAERRSLLVEGEPDPKSRAKADTAIRTAEDDIAGLSDAIAELGRRIEDAQSRLADAKSQVAREHAARERLKAADKIEAAALEMDRAIDVLAGAFETIAEAVPYGAVSVRTHMGIVGESTDELSNYDIARQVLAEGMFRRLPEFFRVVEHSPSGLRSIDLAVAYRTPKGSISAEIPSREAISFAYASGSADALLVQPLRRSAAAIRAGELAPDLPAEPAPPSIEPEPFAEVEVTFTKPVRWINERGYTVQRGAWSHTVPAPVAEAAFAKGVAHPSDSFEARTHLANRHGQGDIQENETLEIGSLPTVADDPQKRVARPTPVDIGVNLHELIAAERHRLNSLGVAA
jgi:HAMP domain-containing protein